MSFLARPLTGTERAYLDAAQADNQAEAARLLAVLDTQDAGDDRRLRAPGALGAAALWYAETLGWPVFPLIPGEKRPATRHGLKDASASPAQVRAWWRASPHSNIGLPTGTHFNVIDIDTPAAITTAATDGLDLPDWDTPGALLATVRTPRGWHLYVPADGTGNAVAVVPGVDYRGKGGYVVAPPSIVDGRRYAWDAAPEITREAA